MTEIFEVRIKALYNFKNYINHKKKNNHCVKNDFPNTCLAVQMRSITLAGSPEFKLMSLQKRIINSNNNNLIFNEEANFTE